MRRDRGCAELRPVNSLASHPRRVAALGVAGIVAFVVVLFALTNKRGRR